KFEVDFKQKQSEMTNIIDTVLKAITDRIAGTLPSYTAKNPKLGATLEPNAGEEEKGNHGNFKSNPHSQPDPLATIAIEQRGVKVNVTFLDVHILDVAWYLKVGGTFFLDNKVPKKYRRGWTTHYVAMLPSDTVKNPKLGATPVLSARSYLTIDPQYSTHIHSSIHAIKIHPKQPEESQVKEPEAGQAEKGNLGNFNSNPHSQPDPLASITIEQVRKLNLMLELLRLVPQSPNMKYVCSKKNDGEVMFIEIIRDHDEPQNGSLNEGEGATTEGPAVEYFDTFPTIDELTYHMIHVFIGNFTYVVDFMIVEDITSIIDPRLSQVLLGRLFIKVSNMTHGLPEGVVWFTEENDEFIYKMPYKIKQYNSLSNLKKEHTKSIYLRNEEDKRRGVDYVMSKILRFYKECLELGPEYVTGLDDDGEVTFDDSSVYSISEGEGDTHQSISIMVQDTPVEEAAFMIIKESDESDGEQEEEEDDDQFNHNSFMFHPGPPTKIAEMPQKPEEEKNFSSKEVKLLKELLKEKTEQVQQMIKDQANVYYEIKTAIQKRKNYGREESSQPLQPPIASTEAPQMVSSVKLYILKKDEHLARFHGIKDAKTLWAAIKTRFGSNVKSKKMQKNVLKQQFENFSVSTSEGLDKGSLPSAWSNISLIMRNKPDIDNLDIDDLHNNLKVYEDDIKGSFGSSSNSHNVAFVSVESTNNTNELNAAYSVSTATGHSSQAQEQDYTSKFELEELEEFEVKAIRAKSARNSGNKSRDAGNAGYKGRDNGKRPAKEKDKQALVVQDRLDRMAKKSMLPTNIRKGTGHRESRLGSAARPKAAASTSAAKPVNTAGPKQSGHLQQALKNKEIVDSGCSRHMTGNKAYLVDSQNIHDGGFIAFGSSRGKITGKEGRYTGKTESPKKPLVKNFHRTSAVRSDYRAPWVSTVNRSFPPVNRKLSTGSRNFPTTNRKVSTATADMGMKGKVIKPSACNISYLSNFEPFDRGYVSFGQGGCKITGKGTIKIGKLEFKSVYFVKDLKALVKKTHNKTPYELLNGRSPRLYFMRPFGFPVTILNTLDPLGKFDWKSNEGFLVGYSVTRNKTNKNAGPQDTNGNAGAQDNVDAGKEVSDQHYIVFPLWSSIYSTYKSSDDKPADDKPKDDTGSKTVEELVNKEDQAYRDELDRLMSQEKEASDVADALRKEIE
nr:xylulose kinase-1 [Tanacetum cinerariifolium]